MRTPKMMGGFYTCFVLSVGAVHAEGVDERLQSLNQELERAILQNHPEEVVTLVEQGANPELVARWTPLLRVAQEGDVRGVTLLLEKGAKPNSLSIGGSTALSAASEGGHLPVMKLLLDAGAKIDARDERGRTALSESILNNRTENVRFLLSQGANIHDEGIYKIPGLTPAILAWRVGRPAIVAEFNLRKARYSVRDWHNTQILYLSADLLKLRYMVEWSVLLSGGMDDDPVNLASDAFYNNGSIFFVGGMRDPFGNDYLITTIKDSPRISPKTIDLLRAKGLQLPAEITNWLSKEE